jgi:hypothetical protein
MSESRPRSPDADEDEDRILDLLHGLLPERERAEALEWIAEDPEAERTLRRRAAAMERARAAGVPRLRREAPTAWTRFAAVRGNPRALIAFGAAAAVVVLLLRLPAGPGSEGFHPLPTDVATLRLRSDSELPDAVISGLEAYASGEWDRAAELLGAAPAPGAGDIVRRAYLASSLALSGRNAEALEILEGLPAEILPEPWGSECEWTRALALHETGRSDEARARMERLAGGTGDVAARAAAFLGR